MSGRKMIIHFNDSNEFFGRDDYNNITVGVLLERALRRFYKNDIELIVDFDHYLCEGPDAREPLDDHRLREIAGVDQQLIPPNSINEVAETNQTPVHLWLCNFENNRFLLGNALITDGQCNSGNIRPAESNDNSKNMHLQPPSLEANVPQPLCTELDLFQASPNEYTDDVLAELFKGTDAYLESLKKPSESSSTSIESLNDDVFKLTNGFRKKPKKQYRTDIFPSKKCKKAKKSKSTEAKATSQTVNKKRKINKKYAFHLQAVEFKKGCPGGRYPRVQPPRHYLDLIRNGQPVRIFVAATKRINGRRYVDALKGFLINKKNPKKPLKNPCIIKLEWINEEVSPPKDYPLKLALIQVSGDIGRKSEVEYNESFNFAQRTVDERSKFSGYNTTNDTDEPEEFQITIVPVKGDTQLEADWSMLIESGSMQYLPGKSNKKQKTNSSAVACASVQGRFETTQESEKNEEHDDDDEEDDDEDYDDEE